MKVFRKLHFFGNVTKVFYLNEDTPWKTYLENKAYVEVDDVTFHWSSVSMVERIYDIEESEEKSLAYAKSLWQEVFNHTLNRQKRNKWPLPLQSIERRANANLSLTDQSDGKKALGN